MGCLGNQLVNKHVFSGSALQDSPPREPESRGELLQKEPSLASLLSKQRTQQAQWVLPPHRAGERLEGGLPQPCGKERGPRQWGDTRQAGTERKPFSEWSGVKPISRSLRGKRYPVEGLVEEKHLYLGPRRQPCAPPQQRPTLTNSQKALP